MQFGHDGRYCWSHVDDAMLAACGADGEDTEDMVNVLRGQEGVEVAALFKAYDGEVRVSLRSSGRINVQAAAAASAAADTSAHPDWISAARSTRRWPRSTQRSLQRAYNEPSTRC